MRFKQQDFINSSEALEDALFLFLELQPLPDHERLARMFELTERWCTETHPTIAVNLATIAALGDGPIVWRKGRGASGLSRTSLPNGWASAHELVFDITQTVNGMFGPLVKSSDSKKTRSLLTKHLAAYAITEVEAVEYAERLRVERFRLVLRWKDGVQSKVQNKAKRRPGRQGRTADEKLELLTQYERGLKTQWNDAKQFHRYKCRKLGIEYPALAKILREARAIRDQKPK